MGGNEGRRRVWVEGRGARHHLDFRVPGTQRQALFLVDVGQTGGLLRHEVVVARHVVQFRLQLDHFGFELLARLDLAVEFLPLNLQHLR